MVRSVAVTTLAALGLSVVAAPAARAQSDPARAAIVAALAKYADALKRGDAAGAASIFAPDGILLVPGSFVTGRDAIAAVFAKRLQTRKYLDGAVTTASVYVSGDLAQETGTSRFTIDEGGQQSTITGHYLTTWRRTGGEWLIAADAPMADPAPAH